MIGGPRRFAEFSGVADGTSCLDVEKVHRRLTDGEALAVAKELFGPNLQEAFGAPDKRLRNERLRLRDAGVSVRQAERVPGVDGKPVSTSFAAKGGRG